MLPYFVHDEKNKLYTDDYAGAYIDDNGFLNILVLEGHIPRFSNENIIYRTSEYSFNYLMQVKAEIESKMIELSIISVGIDDKINKIFIG